MYVEFLAYLENDELPKAICDKIADFNSDFDTSSFMDCEEDEAGEYARFWYGNDGEFYDDDGEPLQEGTSSYRDEDESNERYCYKTYLGLLKLKKEELIKDTWIADGSQFGERPSMQSVIDFLSCR